MAELILNFLMEQANNESVMHKLIFYHAGVVASFDENMELEEKCVNRLPWLLRLVIKMSTLIYLFAW